MKLSSVLSIMSLISLTTTPVLVGGLDTNNQLLLIDPARMCRKGRKFRDSMNFLVPGKKSLIRHNKHLPYGNSHQRLRRKASSFCAKEPEVIREATRGSALATAECQHQFRNRHWNCSALPRSIRRILAHDTRETAFVHAITSAGVTFTITQACSSGQVQDCPCDRTLSGTKSPDGSWEWGGCGDNVHVGYKRSVEILDRRIRRRSDIRSLMMLHNNEAGRLAVRDHMRLVCKCHGLSGSCTLKTCWQKVPSFREIGERLKTRFDGASKVKPGNDGKSVIPALATIKPPDKEDLIYFEDSQDFCKTNKKTGSFGTTSRPCNSSSIGVDGCDLLCCGRGFATKVIRVKEYCKCKFHWCCEVTCDTCQVRKVVTTCR